jgi:multiple sugar transport system substrate-binding protein
MKRPLLVLTALALGFALAQTTLTLSIGVRGFGAATEVLIEQCQRELGVTIDWQRVSDVPNESRALYVTNFSARNPLPDVLAVDVIWPGDFAARGWIAPLNDYFSDAELAEFLPGFAAAAQVAGTTYAIPLYIDGIHLFYRADLLAKYGFEAPTTWEALIEQAATIVAGEGNPDLVGFVSMWAKIEGLFMNYLAFLNGAGGSFFDADGNLGFDGPAGVKALQTMVDMLYRQRVTPESVLTFRPDDARILFQQGRAVFMMVQDFVLDPLTAADSPVRDAVAFTRVPIFADAPADSPSTTSGGFLLAVNAYSRHKAEAADLIRCFTSYDAQVTATLVQGKVPVRASVYDDARVISERPVVAQLGENFNHALTRPSAATGTNYAEISEIMQTEISAALLRTKSPERALRDAATQVRAALR